MACTARPGLFTRTALVSRMRTCLVATRRQVEVRHGSRIRQVQLLRAWVQGNTQQASALYHEDLAFRELAQRAVPGRLLCDWLWPERAAPPVESSLWLRGDEGARQRLCVRLWLRRWQERVLHALLQDASPSPLSKVP